MKLKQNSAILKTLGHLLKRFNFTIFLVLIVVGLIFAVILLNNIVAKANTVTPIGGPGAGSTETPALFDNRTIEKLNTLNSSDKNVNSTLPEHRTNPFR